MRRRLSFLFLALLAGMAIACMAGPECYAESTTEQLTQLVGKLHKNPDDDTLREKIIKLSLEVKPAIPEEARRHFIKGAAISKDAGDAGEQKLAVKSFSEALRIAPWWSDAYYNLAVSQELAGAYGESRRSFKFYILTGPGEKEAREAQDRIYALEGKQDLAKTKSATASERKTREAGAVSMKSKSESAPASLNGAVFSSIFRDAAGTETAWHTLEIHGARLSYTTRSVGNPPDPPFVCTLQGSRCDLDIGNGYKGNVDIDSNGRHAVLKMYYPNGNHGQTITFDRR